MLLVAPWRYDASGVLREHDRYGPKVYLLGIVGNTAVVALYVVTRTVGIPFLGPEAGQVEQVSGRSLVSKAAELVLIATLTRLRRRSQGSHDEAPGEQA